MASVAVPDQAPDGVDAEDRLVGELGEHIGIGRVELAVTAMPTAGAYAAARSRR